MAEKFEQIIQGLDALPLAPGSAARILKNLGNPALSMKALASSIAGEEIIAQRLAQVARSPMYRAGEKDISLEKAMVRLGEEKVRELVIDCFLDGLCPDESAAGKLLRDDAAGCAMAARIVNRISRTAKPDDAYLAGLLRHVGKMALLRLMFEPKGAQKPAQAEPQGRSDDLASEKSRFAFTHDQLGAALLEHWQFSPLIVRATRHHHDFSRVQDLAPGSCLDPEVYNLAAVINLAEGLCTTLGIGVAQTAGDQDLTFQPGAIALSFGEREIDRALSQLKIQWAERH